MKETRVAARKALRYYAVLLKLYPAAFQRTFGAQMRQTFLDHYEDIQTALGRAGIRFWLGVVGDGVFSIVQEHSSTLKGGLDNMKQHSSHMRLWGIGVGIALVFVAAVIMRPGILKVSLAVGALAVLGSIPVLVLVGGYARVRHLRTPLGAVAAKWRIPVGIVFGGMAVLVILALFVVSKANQPLVSCSTAGGSSTSTPPAALVTAQDFSAQGDYDYERGKCAEAIADYSRAIALHPDYAVASNNRAYTYMAQKDFAAALPDLDRAIQLRPDYVNALM